MINELAVPLHWPNRKGGAGRGGGGVEAGSERLQHIAGNKDRHNTPLCIAHSCLFIAAVTLLTAASRTTLERKKPAPDSYRAVCNTPPPPRPPPPQHAAAGPPLYWLWL